MIINLIIKCVFVVLCPDIANIDKFNVTFTPSPWWPRQVHAVDSFFSCNYGYRPSHHNTITCQKDGTWSDTPPTCTRGKEKHIKIVTFVLPHANSFNSILKN